MAKIPLKQEMEARGVLRRRGSQSIQAVGSRLALSAGRSLHRGRFLVLISVRGGVDPGAIVQLQELLGQ
jgi:hypothetical protein